MNLFSDKICAHCGKEFLPAPNSSVLADGFLDTDTGEMSHMGACQTTHYIKKNKGEHAGKYSEMPLLLNF